MENGYDMKLADQFSNLGVNEHVQQQHDLLRDQNNSTSSNNDSLYQVMKAVEAAEAAIKQQAEENKRLRSELQRKDQEIEKYKQDEAMDRGPRSVAPWDEQSQGSHEARQSFVPSGNQEDLLKARSNAEIHYGNSKSNGTFRVHPNDHVYADNVGPSQSSPLSARSISPSGHKTEGDYGSRMNSSGQGLMSVAEVNNSNSLLQQIHEHEKEIMQLRKHLADYSVKEAQARNEKYVLEKRIAYMRLAFDQQQQDLVDAASKALSYRQDIIEENIRLTYALQEAQQERSTFVSSLLPLLVEYSLQPPVPDAQSIVSNVKVLFKHLQEKLILTESKLKELQYQLVPLRSDVNHSNFASQSPSHSIGATLANSNKDGLELVPQPMYSQVKPQVSVDSQMGNDWDMLGRHQSDMGGMTKNVDADVLGRYSPLASR